jgi:predicted alpha/beta superfamily hydrolase
MTPALNQLCFPEVETHLIGSRHVPQTFRIKVALPVRAACNSSPLPVIYATDADLCFEVLSSLLRLLQIESDGFRYLLVGIGYPSANPLAGTLLRARDLTFAGYPELSIAQPEVADVLLPDPAGLQFHGADRFRAFIGEELIPFIEDRYPTNTRDRCYFGHSAGAGFGLYDLFSGAPTFSRYIASSPGLVFDGTSSAGVRYDDHDFMIEQARRFLDAPLPRDDIRLFVSAGSSEEYERNIANWRITSSYFRLLALFNANPLKGLTVTSRLLAEETHSSALPVAFVHGLRAVFTQEGQTV